MRIALFTFILLVIVDIANATDYYVSLSGNDDNEGTTEDTAWRQIKYAAYHAKAGDTVHIKGGDYGHEHIVVRNSGKKARPIVFEGYDGVPLINGGDHKGRGIIISGKSYITWNKIKIEKYQYGVYIAESDYITLDDVEIYQIGDNGIFAEKVFYSTFKNCKLTDIDFHGIILKFSDHNLIDNCQLFAIGEEPDFRPDYNIYLSYSSYNTIQNSYAENVVGARAGHGIGIKDNIGWEDKGFPHSHDNVIKDNTATGWGEGFFVAHGAHDNEIINCTVYVGDLYTGAWTTGLVARDGAYNNIFRNCSVYDTQYGINPGDSIEGGEQISHDNTFSNIIVHNVSNGILFQNAKKNIITNGNFSKISRNLVKFEGNNNGNTITNSSVTDVKIFSYGSDDVEITNSIFWNNGFDTPSGKGNIEKYPEGESRKPKSILQRIYEIMQFLYQHLGWIFIIVIVAFCLFMIAKNKTLLLQKLMKKH